MLKFNTSSQRQPYGGHHYPEYGITFKGESVEDLVKQVKTFRLNNSIPIGDPEQDILLFYSKHWPWLIKGSPFSRDFMEEPDYAAWREWIYFVWKSPGTTVTKKEASDRWDVCSKCPFNKVFKWETTDELNELKKRAYLLRKGMDVPIPILSGFCALHKADLSVLTYLSEPEKFSRKKDGEDCEGCWLGRSLRDHKAVPVTQ